MTSRLVALSTLLVSFCPAVAVAADCFDRTLAVARYHYINPGDISNNWQDIYEISLSNANVSSVTRLTKGAVTLPQYDSSFHTYSPDGTRIAYIESDTGGTNARLRLMDAVDTDNDLEGDNAVVLDTANVDINSVAWGPNNLLVYGKFDGGGDTQIVSATLAGAALGTINYHTFDTDYPDSYSFVANTEVIYDADGRWLKHIDLANNAITILSGPSPLVRGPTGTAIGADIYFNRVVGSTLDLWKALLSSGPALVSSAAFLSTTDYNESNSVISTDGKCLAYLAADLTVTYGPNSDLWIHDVTTGQTQQITQTRDLAGIVWKP